MVKRYEFTHTKGRDNDPCFTKPRQYASGDYVEYEDFEKLLKLAEKMLDDLIFEGMYAQEYVDEMKLIRGENK